MPLIATEQKQTKTIERWIKSGVAGFHIRGSRRMQDSLKEREVPVLGAYEELVVSSSALLALYSQTLAKAKNSKRKQDVEAMFAGLQHAVLKDSILEEAEFLVCGTDGQGQARIGALPLFMGADGQTVMTDIEVLSGICLPQKIKAPRSNSKGQHSEVTLASCLFAAWDTAGLWPICDGLGRFLDNAAAQRASEGKLPGCPVKAGFKAPFCKQRRKRLDPLMRKALGVMAHTTAEVREFFGKLLGGKVPKSAMDHSYSFQLRSYIAGTHRAIQQLKDKYGTDLMVSDLVFSATAREGIPKHSYLQLQTPQQLTPGLNAHLSPPMSNL
jgi:hypothetical protein